MTTRRLWAAVAAVAALTGLTGASASSAIAGTDADTAVRALEDDGILAGTHCSTEDCEGDLLRWEAAHWFVNALDLSPEEKVSFDDVPADSELAPVVSALFERGVTVGCATDPLRYCPEKATTRAQMASFLARAFNLEADERDTFADVDIDSVHAGNIEAIWETGVTRGCAQEPVRYCPLDPITREQAAVMLYRALQYQPEESTTTSDADSSTGGTGNPGGNIPNDNNPNNNDPNNNDPSDNNPNNNDPSDNDPNNNDPSDNNPTAPTVPPARPDCAVVDDVNTVHDIDDHRGDPTETSYALLEDGTLFGHRHLPGGGALCWRWLPRDENGNPSFPEDARAPSHTH